MPTRRRAREIVIQLLYENDLHPEQNTQVAEEFLSKRLLGNKPLIAFARELWKEVVENRWEIDKSLSATAQNWSLRRMAAIDRNILRLAAYEILRSETPGRVAINEAVELAKRYGNHQSGQFVNGILDRLLHESEASGSESEVEIDEVDGTVHDAAENKSQDSAQDAQTQSSEVNTAATSD